MTREEAIKLIEHVSIVFMPTDQYGDYDDPQPYEEAFDMAIEALSEPINCVKCKHYYETEDDTDVHGHCRMDTAHAELVRCNECKWYQGVHGVQGHAPCEWFNKQVLWSDFCSNGELYKGGDTK